MKYVVAGAGGVGGSIASLLADKGMNVTLIARGRHYEKIKEDGLLFRRSGMDDVLLKPMPVMTADEFIEAGERPDVIFLCVKGYSIGEMAPFLKQAAGPDTVIIPVLNGIRMAEKVRRAVPDAFVADGCIYIYAKREAPGVIWMQGDILRIVFGADIPDIDTRKLEAISADLKDGGINADFSDNIFRETMKKFSYVSTIGAAGLYFDETAESFQSGGAHQSFFNDLVREILQLAEEMGIQYDFDLVAENQRIADSVEPDATTSLQRDIAGGGRSEFDTLIMDPVRLGEEYGLEMTLYREVAERFGKL